MKPPFTSATGIQRHANLSEFLDRIPTTSPTPTGIRGSRNKCFKSSKEEITSTTFKF